MFPCLQVKDTIEVDHNVTRHLEVELAATDWDLLVPASLEVCVVCLVVIFESDSSVHHCSFVFVLSVLALYQLQVFTQNIVDLRLRFLMDRP